MDEDKQRFVKELEDEVKKYYFWGKMNNISDVCLTMASVIGSIAATGITAASQNGSVLRYRAAGLAALPAACTFYQRTAKLRERASLHFDYAKDPDLEKFATERAALVIKREERRSHTLQSGAGPQLQTAAAKTDG